MATKKNNRTKKIPAAGIAAGAAAAVAAAGAAYYFYGAKGAKRHRAAAAKWAAGMKREVVKEAKMLQKLDSKVLHGVIDRVAGTYRAARSVDPAEIRVAASELKANWKKIQRELNAGKTGARRAVSRARRAAKRPAKKTAKKKAAKRRR